MSISKSFVSIVLCAAMAAPGFAQTPETAGYTNRGLIGWFSRNYLPRTARSISWADSDRLERLMRAGSIYLSLRDAIALALENNLDIESARFTPPQAEANLLRARSGNLLTNVSTSISQGPSSAGSGILAGTGGFGVGGSSGGSSSAGGQSGVLSGLSVQLAGSAIPNLDPVFYSQLSYSHSTTPLTSSYLIGTNSLVNTQKGWTYGIQQGFMTGTSATLGVSNTFGQWQNSPNNDFNPTTTASLSLSVTQNLLKGFRPSINNREIRIAKNQLKVSDLTFELQVTTTVANVASLYWDLVSYNDVLKVRQQTLDLNTKLYEDNKRRADLGAIAPIDIIQAEAEMKGAEQDVKSAESSVLQQEMTLKSVLTRSSFSSPLIAAARIVPTDRLEMPAQEPVRPIQDLISEALSGRPELEQSRIGLEDTRISMMGVKDALLPTLSASLSTSNVGQAGQLNSLNQLVALPTGGYASVPHNVANVNQFFLGGYGTVLDQIFSRKFPNYSASIALTVPIRNRSAQADLIAQQLQYRQSQIQDKQLQNNIKVSVMNDYTALTLARAAWESAVEATRLQVQTQTGTRRKYELGTATILDVVITQQTTVARQLSEANALNQYMHAKLNLQSVTGRILSDYNVSIEDAKKGSVSRAPDPIPPVPNAEAAPRTPAVMGILNK